MNFRLGRVFILCIIMSFFFLPLYGVSHSSKLVLTGHVYPGMTAHVVSDKNLQLSGQGKVIFSEDITDTENKVTFLKNRIYRLNNKAMLIMQNSKIKKTVLCTLILD